MTASERPDYHGEEDAVTGEDRQSTGAQPGSTEVLIARLYAAGGQRMQPAVPVKHVDAPRDDHEWTRMNRTQRTAVALREAIEAGHWPAGRLPRAYFLSRAFHVNEATMKAAIRNLVTEGLLRSEQGSGIFVRQPQAAGTSHGSDH